MPWQEGNSLEIQPEQLSFVVGVSQGHSVAYTTTGLVHRCLCTDGFGTLQSTFPLKSSFALRPSRQKKRPGVQLFVLIHLTEGSALPPLPALNCRKSHNGNARNRRSGRPCASACPICPLSGIDFRHELNFSSSNTYGSQTDHQ